MKGRRINLVILLALIYSLVHIVPNAGAVVSSVMILQVVLIDPEDAVRFFFK